MAMKRVYIFYLIICFSLASCLTTLAPQVNWYKPTTYGEKIVFTNKNGIKNVYYKTKMIDSLEFNYSLRVESIPKEKTILYNLKILNLSSKYVIIFCDGVKLKSNTIYFKNDCQMKSEFQKIEPMDSLNIRYEEEFLMSDRDWYKRFNKKDTITIELEINNKKYLIPFYYNVKNRMETYPFK